MPSGQTLEVWPVPLASESTLKNKKMEESRTKY